MIEPRSDLVALPLAQADDSGPRRSPFVEPVVEDLGRLIELTQIGGSNP
ncbi:MAG TPA: hypothetical protein VEW03_15775 [Longimicrobiaceae bacterium]|nr:hypothetical protein [Longimicrobiaceae bacterium]